MPRKNTPTSTVATQQPSADVPAENVAAGAILPAESQHGRITVRRVGGEETSPLAQAYALIQTWIREDRAAAVQAEDTHPVCQSSAPTSATSLPSAVAAKSAA